MATHDDAPSWVDETWEGGMRFGLKAGKTLVDARSDFQHVLVVETETLGRALQLDGLWMTSEKDEATYHEMLVHVPLATAPRLSRVLVIGGGDGGTAREVLSHPEVEHVDMVEIDGLVIEACKEHIPAIGAGAWDDPRLHVHVEDGIAWVREADAGSYDVVLVDGSDPQGPAVGLFNEAFYRDCKRVLTAGGVFASQAESPVFQRDTHVAMVKTLGGVFERVHPYYGCVTMYPGGHWSWVWASDAADPYELRPERAARVEARSQVWTRDVHRGAFAVPNHVKRALAAHSRG